MFNLLILIVYIINIYINIDWASLVAQMVKNPPAMRETWAQSLGWEDPLEESMATHSSILAWRIPWTEEPDGLQSMESQRVRHSWVTKHTLLLIIYNNNFMYNIQYYIHYTFYYILYFVYCMLYMQIYTMQLFIYNNINIYNQKIKDILRCCWRNINVTKIEHSGCSMKKEWLLSLGKWSLEATL